MENVVIITAHPTTGLVFTPNASVGKDGIQRGYFRVESSQLTFAKGYANLNKRSALIGISEPDFLAQKARIKAGAKMVGKVLHLDSLVEEPGYKPMEITDKTTGEVKTITSNGKQVYRRSIFTEDLEACDVKLVYDKEGVVAPKVAEATEGVSLV
jgi:hypothetical protein